MASVESLAPGYADIAPDEPLGALDGKFLVLSRYPEPDRSYEVIETLAPSEFCARLGVAQPLGEISAKQVSDLCVAAFDADYLGRKRPASFAYQAADGRVIHQHST